MQQSCMRRWCLPLALALIGLVPVAMARAAKAQKTVVGRVSGPPMGTWMTVSTGGTGLGSTTQVDLATAKVSEKGKSLKRYDLADKMKVRIKGQIRGTALHAETVEILERPSKKEAQSAPKESHDAHHH